MFSNHPGSPKLYVPPSFTAIYNAAKKLDEDELKNLLAKYHTLNIHVGFFTPAGKLAAEGNTNAVLLLIKLRASHHDAARGAAMGGQWQLAEMLRKDYRASANQIAFGAACAGDYQFAKNLYSMHGANMKYIAMGAIARGDEKIGEILRHEYNIHATPLAEIAAFVGNKKYAENLQEKHAADKVLILAKAVAGGHVPGHLIELNPREVEAVMGALAFSHQRKEAESLRQKSNLHSNCVVSLAAKGGDLEYVENLRLNDRADPDIIMHAALAGGHITYAERLRLSLDLDATVAAIGALNAGLTDYVEPRIREGKVNLPSIMREAAELGDWRFVQRLCNKYKVDSSCLTCNKYFASDKEALHALSFIDLPNVRVSLATQHQPKSQSTMQWVWSLFSSKESNFLTLLPSARRINRRIREYGFNYNQALAWDNISVSFWFLQGINLVHQNRITADVFICISSFMLPMPGDHKETEEMLKLGSFMANKNLLSRAINNRARYSLFPSATEPQAKFLQQLASIQNKEELLELSKMGTIDQDDRSLLVAYANKMR